MTPMNARLSYNRLTCQEGSTSGRRTVTSGLVWSQESSRITDRGNGSEEKESITIVVRWKGLRVPGFPGHATRLVKDAGQLD
jgi:hypothetical protein